MKILLSLYDHSGNQSSPYRKNGWFVKQVDIKLGIDILTWDYKGFLSDMDLVAKMHGETIEKIGVICPTPCTDYAVCGAKVVGINKKTLLLNNKTNTYQK